MISREVAGENQRLWYPVALTQSWNVYELFALVEDGLDLAPYYAYIQSYEKPEPLEQEMPKSVSGFQSAVLRDDEKLKVEIAEISGDKFAYTLRLRMENPSDTTQTFDIARWIFNSFQYGGRTDTLTVPAGETIDRVYAFPWEELNQWGISASHIEEIHTAEIITLDLHEPDPWRSYFVCLTGKSPVTTQAILEKTLLAENEDYALYYWYSTIESPCPVSSIRTDSTYRVGLILENRQDERRGYEINAVKVDSNSCYGTAVGNLEPGCSTVVYVDIDYRTVSCLPGGIVEQIQLEMKLTDNWGETISSEIVTAYPNFQLVEEE